MATERDPATADAPALDETRARIDDLDAALFALVEERRRIVAALWERKRAAALPLRDPAREAAMLATAEARGAAEGWPTGAGTRLLAAVLAAMGSDGASADTHGREGQTEGG